MKNQRPDLFPHQSKINPYSFSELELCQCYELKSNGFGVLEDYACAVPNEEGVISTRIEDSSTITINIRWGDCREDGTIYALYNFKKRVCKDSEMV